jgi:rhamnogalacturonan endolyase
MMLTCLVRQTQYYVAVNGQSALYIGTYITAEPSIGELRFIARLDADKLTGPTASNARGKISRFRGVYDAS